MVSNAIGVRCHEVCGPEPHRQRQLGPVHRGPRRDRRLATAVKAFVGVRPALQQRGACAATGGADKPLWPTPIEQERRATRLVRKARLKLAQRSRASHPCPLPPDADRRRTAPSYYILTHLGQRDKPFQEICVCSQDKDCEDCVSTNYFRCWEQNCNPVHFGL